MSEQIETMFKHLRLESDFLDTLIQSSEDVRTILRGRSETATTVAKTPEEQSQDTKSQLDKLHQQMLGLARPLIESRRKLAQVIRALSPDPKKITLTSIASTLEQPFKNQLLDLRREIRTKMDRVYAISMGNQAVLIYTLDYYDRLLPGSRSDSGCYSATGQTKNQYDAGVVENQC